MRVIQALQRAFDHQHGEAVHGGPRQVFRAGPASGIERAGLVMHAAFRIGETTLMGSDGMNSGKPSFQGFALSLSPSEPKEASRLFNALADGGQVHMPLTQTFFSPSFGMVADRFGVSWMIVVPGETPNTQYTQQKKIAHEAWH